MGKSTRREEWRNTYIEEFASKCSGWKLLPQRINQARGLVSSLDAHVTQGGLCYRVLGIKTRGEGCVKCPDPMYLMR